jgi:type II secretory pathway component PulF
MPLYSVTYRDKDRTACFTGKGGAQPHIRASDIQEVYAAIQSQGGTVLTIQEVAGERWRGLLRKIVNMKLSLKFGADASEFAMLCDVLKALLSAGVPVLRAVRLAAGESANPWLGKKLVAVVELIEKGQPLSAAMESLGRAFPIVLTSAVRAGEKIGEVPKSLEKMAVLFRRKAEIRRETVSAMIYPSIAVLVFIVVCVVITIKVPEALEDAIGGDMAKIRHQLPFTVRLLFDLKENPEYLALPFVVIGVFIALVALGKQFKPTRLMIARLARRVPIIGVMRAEFALVDFLESVALNQESGIKIGESLELIRRTTSDALIGDAVERVRERIIARGLSLSEAINPETVFPGLVRQMVAAAEAGGHLAEMLRPIADYYNLKARAALKRLIDAMTPGMIILLGSVIGPVIMGVYKTLMLMQKLVGGGAGV